jgi:hypothetical protein
MIWPSPERATVTVFGGTLDLPVRQPDDALLPAMPPPETAAPEPTSVPQPGVVRIDRIGLELGGDASFKSHIEVDDPLSAVLEMRQTQTISRDSWRTRIDTETRLSCTRDTFTLRAMMRAWDGDTEVCHRTWDREIPRDFV